MKETKKKISKLDSFFDVSKRNSSVKIEIFAGLTTFLAMAYILIVNPNNILWGGTSDPRFASVFIATALGAFIGTLLMALLAKMPLAQAPGMGLNATVGTIVGGALGFGFSYGNAMALVFISGIIFLLLSFASALSPEPCCLHSTYSEPYWGPRQYPEGCPRQSCWPMWCTTPS